MVGGSTGLWFAGLRVCDLRARLCEVWFWRFAGLWFAVLRVHGFVDSWFVGLGFVICGFVGLGFVGLWFVGLGLWVSWV